MKHSILALFAAPLLALLGAGPRPEPSLPLRLPAALTPAELAAALAPAPKTPALVDIRPAWQFAEYRIPGSVNLAPDAVEAWLQQQPADAKVVLVDREGTQAFALAGILLERTGAAPRTFAALTGGVGRWYREVELARTGSGGRAPAMPTPPVTTTKKRNAGC